ncbi:type II secretion system protein GspL, partial [Kaarinaea lacus]
DPSLFGTMPDEVYWFVQEQGQNAGPVYHGDLKTAANHALGCRVVVFVSGVEVVLTDVALPSMNKQKLLKAIPFALEEQLASDVEDNHFAAGDRQAADSVNVAIVERKIIEMWLQGLNDVGIQPDVLTTEVLGVPYAENTWTLLLKSADKQSKSKAILRNNLQAGIALDVANVVPLLRSMLESTAEGQGPEKLNVVVCDAGSVESDSVPDSLQQNPSASMSDEQQAIASQLQALGDQLEVDVEVNKAEQSFLIYLAQQFEELKSINLLQGDYSRRERLEKMFRPWFPAAGIAAAWLLMQIGLMIFDYQKLAARDLELRSQISKVYRDAFPESKNIVDPKRQMEQKLGELRKQTNQSTDMFVLLAKAGDVLSDTDTLLIRTLRFKEETLDLDFEISDLQSLDELKIRLINETDLDVNIQSASSKKGKVESRMQLKAGASSGNAQAARGDA